MTPYDFEFDECDATSDARFDESLILENEKADVLFHWLGPSLGPHEKRLRKRRPRDEAAFPLVVALVVANALKASENSSSRKVHYSRQLSTYSGSTRNVYYPWFLGAKTLNRAIDLMAMGGWLTTEKGFRKTKTTRGRRSSFEATAKLICGCADLGISHHEVARRIDAPVLMLKDKNKKLVPFDLKEKSYSIEIVRAYNRFICQQQLELGVSEDEWKQLIVESDSEAKAKRTKKPRPLADLRNTALYRVFSNNDWNQNGRFHGGWWQSIPSKWRERIKINGEDTVELDYSGFLTRAIYHSVGINYREDPYHVPEIYQAVMKRGMEWETVRESVKLAINVLINAEPETVVRFIPGFKFPKGISKTKAFKLVEDHHPLIRHKFWVGEGLRIMYRESTVCQGILIDGKNANIPVLPIHDSFVVQRCHEGWLYERMVSRYYDEFGFEPVIKNKGAIDLADSERSTSNGNTPSVSLFSGETVRRGPEPIAAVFNVFEDNSGLSGWREMPHHGSTDAIDSDLRFQAILHSWRQPPSQ